MLKILHFSDTHGQQRSETNSQKIIDHFRDCNVLAMTGDIGVVVEKYIYNPSDYPQPYKFFVPGNHDRFININGRGFPSVAPVKIINNPIYYLFISINSNENIEVNLVFEKLEEIPSDVRAATQLVVFVLHEYSSECDEKFIRIIDKVVVPGGPKPSVLILHGHAHPGGFRNSFVRDKNLGDKYSATVSHVCSSTGRYNGGCHLIQWDGMNFDFKFVYVDQNEIVEDDGCVGEDRL